MNTFTVAVTVLCLLLMSGIAVCLEEIRERGRRLTLLSEQRDYWMESFNDAMDAAHAAAGKVVLFPCQHSWQRIRTIGQPDELWCPRCGRHLPIAEHCAESHEGIVQEARKFERENTPNEDD